MAYMVWAFVTYRYKGSIFATFKEIYTCQVYYEACPESKDTSRVGQLGNFLCLLWQHCRRPLPVSHARLTVVEPALFEWDMFAMAAPNQSPAKCEVRSIIRFLNAKGEHPVEIHKQIVAVYGNVMNRQNVTKWCREFSLGRTDVHDEQRSSRPSLISDGGRLLWLGDKEAGSKS